MNTSMPLISILTGYQEEWLLRAATRSPRGAVMPPPVVAALAEAGLGEPNELGTLDINDAGLEYLKTRDLPYVPRRRNRI
jgi:hypothetical protein